MTFPNNVIPLRANALIAQSYESACLALICAHLNGASNRRLWELQRQWWQAREDLYGPQRAMTSPPVKHPHAKR